MHNEIKKAVVKGLEATLDYCSIASKIDPKKMLSVVPLSEKEILENKKYVVGQKHVRL
jgi:hypothetical protein